MSPRTKVVDVESKLVVIKNANERLGEAEKERLPEIIHDPALRRDQSEQITRQYENREMHYVADFMKVYLGAQDKKVYEDLLDTLARFEGFPKFVIGIFRPLVSNGNVGLEVRVARIVDMLSDKRLLEALNQFKGVPEEVSDGIIRQLASAVHDGSYLAKEGEVWKQLGSMIEVMNSDVYGRIVKGVIGSESRNNMNFIVTIALECSADTVERMERVLLAMEYSGIILNSFSDEQVKVFVRAVARSEQDIGAEKGVLRS